jgi:hypothetical protein
MDLQIANSYLPGFEPDVAECRRCQNVRPLTHRVRSELLDIRVCTACAVVAESFNMSLGITGGDALVVEEL